MNEKWAKWAILDIATEGFLEPLHAAIAELDHLYPGAESAPMARRLVRELVAEGLVELSYETLEPTGDKDEKGRRIVRSSTSAIAREDIDAVLSDLRSWDTGLDVRITYQATEAGKALRSSAPGPGVSFGRHQWRPSDDWLDANL